MKLSSDLPMSSHLPNFTDLIAGETVLNQPKINNLPIARNSLPMPSNSPMLLSSRFKRNDPCKFARKLRQKELEIVTSRVVMHETQKFKNDLLIQVLLGDRACTYYHQYQYKRGCARSRTSYVPPLCLHGKEKTQTLSRILK